MSVTGLANPRAYPEFIQYVFKALESVGAKPPSKLLDLGAGLGMLGCVLKVMAPQPVELIAVEIGKGLRVTLKELGIYEEVYAEYTDLDPKTRFDCIFANHVLEHIIKSEAYELMEDFKRRTNAVVLGFPTPKDKGHYSEDGEHKWGAYEDELREIEYRRVKSRKQNNVYVWLKNGGRIPDL